MYFGKYQGIEREMFSVISTSICRPKCVVPLENTYEALLRMSRQVMQVKIRTLISSCFQIIGNEIRHSNKRPKEAKKRTIN